MSPKEIETQQRARELEFNKSISGGRGIQTAIMLSILLQTAAIIGAAIYIPKAYKQHIERVAFLESQAENDQHMQLGYVSDDRVSVTNRANCANAVYRRDRR
jgi:hypothetical protein